VFSHIQLEVKSYSIEDFAADESPNLKEAASTVIVFTLYQFLWPAQVKMA
jgi:hypothetical protein